MEALDCRVDGPVTAEQYQLPSVEASQRGVEPVKILRAGKIEGRTAPRRRRGKEGGDGVNAAPVCCSGGRVNDRQHALMMHRCSRLPEGWGHWGPQ